MCPKTGPIRQGIIDIKGFPYSDKGLLQNRLCDENSKFRAKISKRDDAYLAKIRGGAVCNLQPKFRICSRSLLGNSPDKFKLKSRTLEVIKMRFVAVTIIIVVVILGGLVAIQEAKIFSLQLNPIWQKTS